MVKKVGTNGPNALVGSSLADVLIGNGGDDVLVGKGGNDRLFGGRGDDLLSGGAGNDRLDGGHGDDVLKGGAGNDRIADGKGVDNVKAGAGNDVVLASGDGSADTYDGGAGLDTIDYSASRTGVSVNLAKPFTDGGAKGDVISNFEVVIGSALSDRLIVGTGGKAMGGNGDDSLFVDTVADGGTLDGGAGNDYLIASNGNDILAGGNGNDRISASGGNDVLNGGAGDDRLDGDHGADDMTGGSGRDLFVFFGVSETGVSPASRDVIRDFSQAEGDKIVVSVIDAFFGGADDAFRFVAGSTPVNSLNGGEIGYYYDAANDVTIVHAELGDDGLFFDANMTIELKGNIVLTAADFIL